MIALYLFDAVMVTVALVSLRLWISWRRRSGAPYPPGPKGLPYIGNVLDMPGRDEWEAARKWGEKYGDLVFIQNFGTSYLFVNSYEAAVELFEKRGDNYSSRPRITMMELEGWTDWITGMMPYGAELRKSRQYLNKFFQKSVVKDYHEVQTQSTRNLLLKLLQKPDDFRNHIIYSAADTIIRIAYGYDVVENDPYVELTNKGMEAWSEGQAFFLVNALPSLCHLPTWFPGTNFNKIAQEGYKLSMAMYREPFDKAKAKIADGTGNPSMTSKLLESQANDKGDVANENIIAKAVAVAYAAGGDTTVSALLTFLLAMVLYPDSMRKGQEELDKIIGRNNLPSFEDRPRLPYIEAICAECLRWQTVTPISIAHLCEKDDIYNGYFIPAGTVVYPNSWAMLRDPKRYPEPEKFIPERWLSAPGKERPLDANKMAFGFGRRICPGRFFAENSKAIDEHGVPITPAEDYMSLIIRHPKPFKCKITPRSDEAVALIYQAGSTKWV